MLDIYTVILTVHKNCIMGVKTINSNAVCLFVEGVYLNKIFIFIFIDFSTKSANKEDYIF